MKQTIFLALIFAATTLGAQNLSDVYKGGTVNLIPDTSYGQENDWNLLFADYNQMFHDRQTGLSKSIVVAPDGSVFMSHSSRHSISKFDKNGNFVKEFGKKGGKNPADFIYSPSVEGILDGKYLYTSAADGRMHFFDLNGSWVKTIALKYMASQTTPMKNGHIAIMGHVPWKGGQSRHIISILNFNTEKEKIIYSEFSSPEFTIKGFPGQFSSYSYTNSNGEKKNIFFINMGPEFLSRGFLFRERFATTKDGNLVIGYPKTGLIKILDTNGNVLKQFNATTKPEVITQEDREQYYQNALKQVAQTKAEVVKTPQDEENWAKYIAQFKDMTECYRDPESYPAHLPYFSEMLVDSDNNILLFRFTREKGSNRFDVYSYDSTGKEIATSSFIAGDYDLKINPGVFKFHNGNIYSWLRLNSVKQGNPMRLVKFKVGKK
jgi:hypothetical protein